MGLVQRSLSRSTRHILSILKLFVLLSPLPVLSNTSAAAKAIHERNAFKVGVILDLDSLLGDQMRMAIEIACQDVNSISSTGSYYIKPYYINSHAKPLRAISAAEKLIKRKNVKVIVGLETWEGATLVAEIANQSQVPVISFARDHVTPTLTVQTLWPSLFQMSTDESDHIRCIVDIVSSYNRQRVSIIYEAGAYDTMYSKLLNSLSEELGKIGSTVEDQLILQAFSSPTRAEVSLEEKLMTLKGKASPIFIVLGLSAQGSAHFLKEAKKMGLFYGNSVWIFAEKPFTNLLTSVKHSAISSTVKGAIGIITYRPKNQEYREFKAKFLNMFHHKYGKNFNFEPGIDAVRAYDCIMTVKNAIDAAPSHDIMPELLLNRISRTRLMGLSGAIRFEKGQLAHQPNFQLVSVDGNEYREAKLWSPNSSFSRSFVPKQISRRNAFTISDILKTQERQTPSEKETLVIGVPGKTPFDKFVKEEMDDTTGKAKYIGLCIDVFEKAVSHFPDGLKYEFFRHDGTYDELVNKVHDKELIVHIRNTSSYEDEFKGGKIAALFLEYPYERAFFTEYCYGYVATHENYRFGGFGFVTAGEAAHIQFPRCSKKGSPLAENFSEAIMELSQSGEMKRLENKWFSPECTMRNITNEKPRLGLNSFWALYAFNIATSTGCLLLACLCTRRNCRDHEEGSNGDNMSATEMSVL
ncbi:hypothetical protein NL676_008268 [Syzygium grande]|nr:hypothetical protein NL676_008268 [Syzygium grande]